MTDSYDKILKASKAVYVKNIFSDEEGNLIIAEDIMKDITSN